MKIEYTDTPIDIKQTPSPSPEEQEVITLPGPNTTGEAAEVWEKTASTSGEPVVEEAPITKEDVSGRTAETEKPPPDRVMVAGELAKFLATKKETPKDPLLEQTERITQALDQLQTPAQAPLPVDQTILAKLEALEQRELERERLDTERAAQTAYDEKMNDYKDKVVYNINSQPEKYPGLIALGQEESVYSQLLVEEENEDGTVRSEEDIASEVEEGLREVNKLLNEAFQTTPSKETKPSTPPKPKRTLTPALATDGTPAEFSVNDFLNKKAAQEALWDRVVRGSD